MTFETLKEITKLIGTPYLMMDKIAESCTTGDWKKNADKFNHFMETGVPAFSVFAKKGNRKLPFVAFSALPEVTCPGAGDCLNWCYSYKAWRYPAAFFRQLQNTILVIERSEYLTAAFMGIAKDKTVRLYVDGDFDSAQTLEFWMNLCHKRKDLNVYGYSKSWELFLAYTGKWPTNYIMNVSSGSRYGNVMKKMVMELPITRGEFVAVKIKEKKYGPEYIRQTLEAFGGKAMVCPQTCGDCRGNGEHACGSRQLQGIPILIGVH